MNTNNKSIAILLLAISLFVSGCSSEQVFGPTITQTPTMTITPTLTPTFTPTSTSTSTSTNTLTPSPTATITYVPFPDSPPLSKLMLSPDDIAPSAQGDPYNVQTVDMLFNINNESNLARLSVIDNSQALKSICLIECTWQILSRAGYTVNITMIRAQDEQGASRTAAKLYNVLNPFDDYEDVDDLESVNAPPQNTHIVDSLSRGIVIITSRGPIAIDLVLSGSFGDDPGGFIFPAIAFANLQLNKLKRANVVP